jgi:pimeloyl-ACP methyl ester carboxylesterase
LKNLVEIAPKLLRTVFSNGEINWKVYGNGAKKILAFHGFGQSPEAFATLARSSSDHTMYCMDLPFHGATTITNKRIPMAPEQVVEIVNNLIKQEQIGEFSIVGFSIGVKLAFPLIQGLATQISEVTLIAPDGIKENIWYRIATGSATMRWVFKRILRSSHTTDVIVSAARSVGFVDSKTAAFAKSALNNKQSRARVYDIWCYLRELKLDKMEISQIINKRCLSLIFVVGEKDRVIPPESIVGLSAKIERKKIIRLPGGHYDLIRQYSKALASKSGEKT